MKLALCIPAYNAKDYLPRLLESAKRQLIPFDEILVYNDCSSDDTEEVATFYGAKVINGDINRGCSYGKNVLAKATSCDWIHFHDADDDLLENFTKEFHDWENNNNSYDVLILNYTYVDNATKKIILTANHNKERLREDPLKYAIENKLVNFGVYKRTTFLQTGGFDLDSNVLFNEDNALHQSLARAGLKFDFLEVVTCINFRYNISMSRSNQLKCLKSNYYVILKTSETFGFKYKREISSQLWSLIGNLAVYSDWQYVLNCIKLSRKLGYNFPPKGNCLFKIFVKADSLNAVKIREFFIRIFKPKLRRHL